MKIENFSYQNIFICAARYIFKKCQYTINITTNYSQLKKKKPKFEQYYTMHYYTHTHTYTHTRARAHARAYTQKKHTD